MVPQDAGLRHGPPRWLPPAVALGLVAGVLALLQAFGTGGGEGSTATSLPEGPFGPALDAALAYVGVDRVLYLVDLRDGYHLGSKSIGNDRRPAAASSTHAYLGRLSAAPGEANWDRWRVLPWAGTEYADLSAGDWMTYSPGLAAVVAAMAPLPEGSNGVRLLVAEPLDLAVSSGTWGPIVPVGEAVLARELAGSDEAWWLLAPGTAPREVSLPRGFRPVAGAPGVVAGSAAGAGVIADLGAGTLAPLVGGIDAAAAWDPAGSLLAVVTDHPPQLTVYRRSGSVVWLRSLEGPASALRYGVAWSPDGSFLVVAEGGTLAAYTAGGARIGSLDPLQPPPQVAAAWVELVPLPAGG